MAKRVFLAGFMGCGKSSFGRRMAAELGWKLVDTDREVEKRAGGRTIAEIFEREGEGAFRTRERKVIEDAAAAEENVIVALGGGAVCREGAMEELARAGEVVYLKMGAARLVSRMSVGGRMKRPKIAGMGDAELTAFIEKTLPEREKFYNQANFVLDCGSMTDGTILKMLVEHAKEMKDK